MISILYRFAQGFLPAELTPNEQRKRSFIVLFQFLLFPVLLFFVITKSAQQGFTAEVWLLLTGAALSLAVLFSLRYARDLMILFRVSAAFIILVAIYEVALGAGEGVAFLWFYFHPLTSFFVFGKKEGAWWIGVCSSCLLMMMLFDLGVYHYPFTLTLRFGFSYLVVSLLSYGLEETRERYYTALEREKLALEAALQQVQTLRRLMPICASCKKIRDDNGYWHEVERYIGGLAEVQFNHAVCPNCRAKLPVNQSTLDATHQG